jgi:hypothetical protein
MAQEYKRHGLGYGRGDVSERREKISDKGCEIRGSR